MPAASGRHIEPLLPAAEATATLPPRSPLPVRIRPGRMFGPPVLVTQRYVDSATATTFNQALDATVANAATIIKSVGKTLTATTIGNAATLIKSVGKPMTATPVANTASMVRSVGKTLTATVANAATMVRSAAKTVTATAVGNVATIAGDVARFFIPSRPLPLRLFPLQQGPPLMTAQAPVRRTAETYLQELTATAGNVATIIKDVGKFLTTTVGNVASLTAIRVFLVNLTATIGSSASMIKSVGKTLGPTIGCVPDMTRECGKNLAATVDLAPSLVKEIGKELVSNTIDVVGSLVATFRAASAASADIIHLIGGGLAKRITNTIYKRL